MGGRRADQCGKAGMKDSGKARKRAEPVREAVLIREMAFWVVFVAERKCGEA